MIELDAMVLSVGEPQLDRCLEAVRNQKIPFKNIIHMESVVPESEANNRGLQLVKSEWVAKIDGDIILSNNATETMITHMGKYNGDKISSYHFALYDPFIRWIIGATSVFRTELFKAEIQPDKLGGSGGGRIVDRLARRGWKAKKFIKEGVVVGVHFDKPDEFQVFRRYYCDGVRANDNSFNIRRMTELYEETHNPLYSLAIEAIRFAKAKNRSYVGSRNIDFDRKLFEEFKATR